MTRQAGITDAEAKVKNRALDVFKVWLLNRTRPQLDAADPAALAKLYPPLEADDIALMILVRRRSVK